MRKARVVLKRPAKEGSRVPAVVLAEQHDRDRRSFARTHDIPRDSVAPPTRPIIESVTESD